MPDRHPGSGEPEHDREDAYSLLQRGQALMHDHHDAQAVVVLERARALEPRKMSILEALARACYDSRQYSRATEAFEAILEIDPSAHYAHFGLGLSLMRLDRHTEARTHLRLAAALHPSSETYRAALRRAERKAGKAGDPE